MALSRRLQVLASLVPEGARVCDVGTDHARLPIFLMAEKRAKGVIATDLRPLPLENARRNIAASGVSGIETRLCDGLSFVGKDEADTVIIAGIGGEVISGIIARAAWLKEEPYPLLILQPTTAPEVLRRYLCRNGFEIESDTAVGENGKLYSVMAVRFTEKSTEKPEAFYYTGKVNPETADGFLYIEKQYRRLKSCADALRGIPGKQTEYLYYKKLSNNLRGLLSGE